MNNLSLCKRLYILHINNLNDTTQERDLYFFFSFYKKMHSLKICFNLFTNQSLGYGYLNFQNYKDAKFILKKINFYSDDYIFKIPLYLTWKSCNIRTKTSKFAKLFVKNFKPYFYTRFLFQSFLVFGKIVLYKVTSTDTKNTRREFIQFKKHSNSIKILNNSDNFFFKFSGLLTNICTIYKKINDNFTNIYIDNVNFEFSKLIWIKKMFEKIGPVWSIFINKHKKNNITNYIFINFRQLINTKKAISLINNKKNKSSIAIVYRVEKDLKKKTFSNKILFDNKIGVSYFLVRNNFLFINFDKTFFVFFLVYFFFFSEKIINIKLKKKQKNSVKSFCILNSEGQIDLLQTTFRKIIFLKKKKNYTFFVFNVKKCLNFLHFCKKSIKKNCVTVETKVYVQTWLTNIKVKENREKIIANFLNFLFKKNKMNNLGEILYKTIVSKKNYLFAKKLTGVFLLLHNRKLSAILSLENFFLKSVKIIKFINQKCLLNKQLSLT